MNPGGAIEVPIALPGFFTFSPWILPSVASRFKIILLFCRKKDYPTETWFIMTLKAR
jgi:hypothetical protein